MNGTIRLIAHPSQAVVQGHTNAHNPPVIDRTGGELQGTISSMVSSVLDVSIDAFSTQLRTVISQAKSIAEHLGDVGDFRAEEIKLGLAISAEGSVGIATAGAETSIEITFKRSSSGCPE